MNHYNVIATNIYTDEEVFMSVVASSEKNAIKELHDYYGHSAFCEEAAYMSGPANRTTLQFTR